MEFTILIPYRDGGAALGRLLRSLPAGLDVLVVDDLSANAPAEVGSARVHRLAERGYFAGAVNAGMELTRGDVVVLNQDIWFTDERWLARVAAWQADEGLAIAGDGVFGHPAWPMGYVQGTLMYLRREAWESVGPFDEAHWPLWGCTAEWQARACRRGWRASPERIGGWQHERRGRFGRAIEQALREEAERRDLFIRTPPLVSVIVPCRNYGRYIPDLMASLIGGETSLGRMPGQTFQGFEVILVDDASTDDSREVMARYADPWRGVHLITLENNVGTAEALNVGIRAAHGRYVLPMGADDMLEPAFIERYLEVIEANPHSLIYSDACTVAHGRRRQIWRLPDYDFEVLLERNHVPVYAMYPRRAWEEVGGYPAQFRDGREDWAFAVALGRAGYCGIHLHEPLYLYRREGQNRSLRNANERARFLAQMQETFPDLYGGERPMGCCGGRNKSKPAAGGTEVAIMRVGEKGMELLEYIGDNYGTMTIAGPITHQTYRFGGNRRLFYVDARDVEGLVGRRVKGGVLRRYVAPPPPPPEPRDGGEKSAADVIDDIAPVSGTEGAATEPVAEAAEERKPRRRGRPRKAEARAEEAVG